jgi:ATP-dependent DNA helicase RecG
VRIVSEKEAFQWELARRSVHVDQANPQEVRAFVQGISQSPKVSPYVAGKSEIEILEYYNCVHDGNLTNVGTLFMGTPQQRAALSYPIMVQ